MKASCQSGDRDVERVEILFRILGVDLDDDRVTSTCAGSHRHPFERDAFALNRLDELHERGSAHDRHGFLGIGAKVHAAKAASERLLR